MAQMPGFSPGNPAYGLPAGAPTVRIEVDMKPPPAFVIPQGNANLSQFAPPQMSENECRNAIRRWQQSDAGCCGKKPEPVEAGWKMEKYQCSPAYNYTFSSFVEVRSISEDKLPFDPMNSPLDSHMNGLPPAMWDFEVHPEKGYFVENKQEYTVPHTDYLLKCETCEAIGSLKCTRCDGKGYDFCKRCNGDCKHDCKKCLGTSKCGKCKGTRMVDKVDPFTGMPMFPAEKENCGQCGGSGVCDGCVKGRVVCEAEGCAVGRGKIACKKCEEKGRVTCESCQGFCWMKHFQKLTVRYSIKEDKYTQTSSNCKSSYLQRARGDTILNHEDFAVAPVVGFTQQVDQQSRYMADEHSKKHHGSDRRILRQKHCLDATPVHEVQCRHQGKSWSFFIVGLNQRVHADSYPAQGCACTIM